MPSPSSTSLHHCPSSPPSTAPCSPEIATASAGTPRGRHRRQLPSLAGILVISNSGHHRSPPITSTGVQFLLLRASLPCREAIPGASSGCRCRAPSFAAPIPRRQPSFVLPETLSYLRWPDRLSRARGISFLTVRMMESS